MSVLRPLLIKSSPLLSFEPARALLRREGTTKWVGAHSGVKTPELSPLE